MSAPRATGGPHDGEGTMERRPVARPEDIEGVQRLASRLWPDGWHPGGLGWALARGQLGREVVLWSSGRDVVGWAARDQHEAGELLAQVVPGRSDAAIAVADWLLEGVDRSTDLTIEVPSGADALRSALQRAGFVRRPAARITGMRRSTAGPSPAHPAGYRIRPVGPEERDARVGVHRAAWRPAAMPWHPDHAPEVDPDATSSFSARDYDAVRQTWLYDPALDLVAESSDGDLAACCIAWLDPATGVAEVEPLGVAPAHRRQGLAVALCHEVATRVRAAGGRELFINTGPQDDYPAPAGAYAKARFQPYERAATYVLPRGGDAFLSDDAEVLSPSTTRSRRP